MYCSQCGTKVPECARYCYRCGARILGAADVEPDAVPPCGGEAAGCPLQATFQPASPAGSPTKMCDEEFPPQDAPLGAEPRDGNDACETSLQETFPAPAPEDVCEGWPQEEGGAPNSEDHLPGDSPSHLGDVPLDDFIGELSAYLGMPRPNGDGVPRETEQDEAGQEEPRMEEPAEERSASEDSPAEDSVMAASDMDGSGMGGADPADSVPECSAGKADENLGMEEEPVREEASRDEACRDDAESPSEEADGSCGTEPAGEGDEDIRGTVGEGIFPEPCDRQAPAETAEQGDGAWADAASAPDESFPMRMDPVRANALQALGVPVSLSATTYGGQDVTGDWLSIHFARLLPVLFPLPAKIEKFLNSTCRGPVERWLQPAIATIARLDDQDFSADFSPQVFHRQTVRIISSFNAGTEVLLRATGGNPAFMECLVPESQASAVTQALFKDTAERIAPLYEELSSTAHRCAAAGQRLLAGGGRSHYRMCMEGVSTLKDLSERFTSFKARLLAPVLGSLAACFASPLAARDEVLQGIVGAKAPAVRVSLVRECFEREILRAPAQVASAAAGHILELPVASPLLKEALKGAVLKRSAPEDEL